MNEQLRQFGCEYAEAFKTDLVPLYIGLAVLTGWLGFLTIFIAQIQSWEPTALEQIMRPARALLALFVVYPFAGPALEVALTRWFDE